MKLLVKTSLGYCKMTLYTAEVATDLECEKKKVFLVHLEYNTYVITATFYVISS